MGSRGFSLESKAPRGWQAVGMRCGFKILERIDERCSVGLPNVSGSPGTTYLSYRKDGSFKQLRVFGANRLPEYEIEFGRHNSQERYFHLHRWKNGVRVAEPTALKPGDALYEKYRPVFEEWKRNETKQSGN